MFRQIFFRFWKRVISFVLILSLGISPEFIYAQSVFVSSLPVPGLMVEVSDSFEPILVKGLVVYPDKPLNFDFIVDSGNDSTDHAVVKEQSLRMAQYFLAAITVPEEQLWVNLSPYEKDRVVENELGQTVLGRDMLAQDYILKQVTSSLIYPEKGLGKEFWARVYAEAQAKFGTTDIPVDAFNKVWIMPDKAEVFEKGNVVYVTDAKLKVMLDSDRTAMSLNASDTVKNEKAEVAKIVMREIVLPAIEKDVNEGKNFAIIRQVYHAAILAKWYREHIQNTLLADAYVGKNKVMGVSSDEKALKEEIYQRYIAAYKKGVFNYIREEAGSLMSEMIPRKYFSGGENLHINALARTGTAFKASRFTGKVFQIDFAMVATKGAAMKPLSDKKTIQEYMAMAAAYSNLRNTWLELPQTEAAKSWAKFDINGNPNTFEGNSVVGWFDEATTQNIIDVQNQIKSRLIEQGLQGKVAFVAQDSFHLTIYDLVNPADFKDLSPKERAIKMRRISESLENFFRELKHTEESPIEIEMDSVGSFMPSAHNLLLYVGHPKTSQDLDRINAMRQRIYEDTGVFVGLPFVSHITMGYIVQPMSKEEYGRYNKILNDLIKEKRLNLTVALRRIALNKFENMNVWDNKNPVLKADFSFQSKLKNVISVTDSESSDISLVGGKAASLKELGSIAGVSVPAGFNVTTKVYADYLVRIGAAEDIAELEELSEQWKALQENDLRRETLTIEMRKLAEKIQGLILNGDIPAETQAVILASYRKLEKDGQPALVAVRSSATAEDMPAASFAGQYKTYLNQQGDAQVIQAIKQVWASTYNMNAIEYRNKQNMQHSKNRMCALILEMVNPQSAGTAFSVDLETGAPFISINNSYGLGEAEVSGIVTSDTWIVDPNTGVILKRRMGEKGQKIVYDPDAKQNVTTDVSVSERERYAISKEMAREIALLVKRIQDHYVKRNPNLNHMDVEYAVTFDGRIIFTQARPETVWTSGQRALIAINSQVVEKKNKDAVKANGTSLYPEIFKGGVSGSPGVARGVLRVVSTVAEAEEFVKPGDIMVAPNTTNAWEHVMGRASGIITEIGGPGNHTAVVSREQKKAAIVGAVGAMQNLRMYEGKMVTIDATSKRVYLNSVPQELEYSPDKIAPIYGDRFSQTLEDSWEEAKDTLTTTNDPDGTRWISKPNHSVRLFLQTVFARSHQEVARQLNPGSTFRDRVNNEGKYQVNFDDIFPWMERLAEKPLEGPDSLSSIHESRVANIRDFLEKSENLTLTTESVKAWLDSFVTLNGYMGYAYNMYRITEGLMQDALKRKQIPEPYLSQVWLSMAVWVGDTEAVERNRDYGRLLEEVKVDGNMRKDLEFAVKSDKGFDAFSIAHPEFYAKLNEHAFNYKIIKNTDDIFTSAPFHSQLAKELLKDASDNRTIAIYNTKPEQFYPDDLEFTRIARLAFFSSKIRQDAHHFKVRGQWKFVEVLRPLAEFLIEKEEIKAFGDIFDHTPEWIIEKVGEYEKAGRLVVAAKPLFHIKPYEIQDLAVINDAETSNETIDDAMMTSMGRWQFEGVQWDPASGRLKLLNATRIEGTLKPEFLENRNRGVRDIVLATRMLNEEERTKIDGLAGSMGIDIRKVVVIKLEQTVAFHRIYGLYADGVVFIREDILSEGNQDQIHEALDHLRLKPTGHGYEALKKIQYHGDLRSLITKLSHRTIKQKLLFGLYGKKEASRIMSLASESIIKDAIIKAILVQLGGQKLRFQGQIDRLQSDVLFYDSVTREMVRNKVGFVKALSIVNELSRDLSEDDQRGKAVDLVQNGGIEIQDINVTSKSSSTRIKFNDQAVRDVLKDGFNGFKPVIVNIKPVQSFSMILGENEAGFLLAQSSV